MKTLLTVALCLSAQALYGQARSGGITDTGVIDFSAASVTKPSRIGTVVPGSCSVGESFYNTSTQAFYMCPAGTFVQISGSGGSLTYPLTVGGAVNSGGVPYFSATTTQASSATLPANALIKGGGAGLAPSGSSLTDNGTTVTTAEPLTALSFSAGASAPAASVCAPGSGGMFCSGVGTTPTGTFLNVGVLWFDASNFTHINNNNVDSYVIQSNALPVAGFARSVGGTSKVTTGELSGDVTTSGAFAATVGRLQGSIVLSGTPSAGQVLTATTATAANWQTPAGGGASCLSAAGQYLVPGGAFAISAYPESTPQSIALPNFSVANSTLAFLVFIPCSFTPNKIAFNIQTAGLAGCKMEIGLYNSSGTLVIHSGVVTDVTTVACNSTGNKLLTNATSPAAVGMGTSYSAGWYTVGVTSNETTARILGMSFASGGAGGLLNAVANVTAQGPATTAGALAATLGAVSGATPTTVPLAVLVN